MLCCCNFVVFSFSANNTIYSFTPLLYLFSYCTFNHFVHLFPQIFFPTWDFLFTVWCKNSKHLLCVQSSVSCKCITQNIQRTMCHLPDHVIWWSLKSSFLLLFFVSSREMKLDCAACQQPSPQPKCGIRSDVLYELVWLMTPCWLTSDKSWRRNGMPSHSHVWPRCWST